MWYYYEKAAQQGHMGSQYNMGVYYLDGLGCEQSFECAAEWLKKAADQGDVNATATLGNIYATIYINIYANIHTYIY